jgi:hypothetical protein
METLKETFLSKMSCANSREILPECKDFSVVFESIYFDGRNKIDVQIPFNLITDPKLLLDFDENEIKRSLERSNIEVDIIEENPETFFLRNTTPKIA